jgi:hypothetical protein
MTGHEALSRRNLLLGGLPALGSAATFGAHATGSTPPVARQIYWGNRTRREVAITINADTGARGMGLVLDTLGENGITASFGLTGRWVKAHPLLSQRIVNEGHHLISHSMTHRSFTRGGPGGTALPRNQRWWELDQSEATFQDIVGVGAKPWFRPPYTSTNWSVARDCYLRGWDMIAMRSIDGLGWMRYPWQFVRTRCLNTARNGTIYLFHVGLGSTDPQALGPIIKGLQSRGYGMGSVPWVIRP